MWSFKITQKLLHHNASTRRKNFTRSNKFYWLTLLITAILVIASRILNQIPISCARSATGLLRSDTILSESMRISKMLFARAKNGARGNAATKIVMNPNWITEVEIGTISIAKQKREKRRYNIRNGWTRESLCNKKNVSCSASKINMSWTFCRLIPVINLGYAKVESAYILLRLFLTNNIFCFQIQNKSFRFPVHWKYLFKNSLKMKTYNLNVALLMLIHFLKLWSTWHQTLLKQWMGKIDDGDRI